jgi:ABC-type antimicrobial peptide transport system permease subunit
VPGLVVFMPMAGMPSTSAVLVVRADRHVAGLAPTAARVVREQAPNALIEDVMTLAEYKAKSVSPQRLNAELISAFGILAVVIAAVGIAGVLAFSVSARTNEIGIRMSLGADSGRVQRMILREGGALVAAGIVLGSVGAFITTGVMRQLLFGVEPHDPATFVVGTVAMATVGIVACWIPARRAARIDPMTAIRV